MSEPRLLEGEEVVIHVPRGTAQNIRIEETTETQSSQIVVRVSRTRKAVNVPVLGVIVK